MQDPGKPSSCRQVGSQRAGDQEQVGSADCQAGPDLSHSVRGYDGRYVEEAQKQITKQILFFQGGIELNHSLTITGVTSSDLGTYSCVAINNGGVSEMEVTLTFDSPGSVGGILPLDEKQLTIVIGVASGVLLILIVLLIILCCCCR